MEKFNIPGIVLMENAAMACTRELGAFKSAIIVCGKGNNGGDGLAIARQLMAQGKRVKVCLLFGDSFSGDALINYTILKSIAADVEDFSDSFDFGNADCVVDAIFGTGFSGEVSGVAREAIEKINKLSKYTLSVDIPSGVNADTGAVETVCIKADKTVTFAALKPGLLLYPGAEFAGEIVLDSISMPENVFKEENIDIKTTDKEYIKDIIPKRRKNSQKGDYGKILVIGGSVGMAGAVSLAAKGALRTGAGLVTACVPREINDIVQCSCTEAMTCPVDFKKDLKKILEKLSSADVVLFGNGIGRDKNAEKLLGLVLLNSKVTVIDADGLFALSKNPDILNKRSCDVILTPHSMEMARLIDKDVDFVEKNRFKVAKEFAQKYRLTLVLKGNHSIITAPDGKQSVNMTGNCGMATAGSGDVLAGICAAFSAVCKEPFEAAEAAVYIHGAAGDRAAEELGEYSLCAGDIIGGICHTLPVEKNLNL